VLNNAGTAAYVANQGDSTISGYAISTTGTLTAIAGSPFGSGSFVTALAAEKTGKYLAAAANGGGPDLTLYSFDSTTAGKLNSAASATTGTDPTGAIAIAATH